MAKERDYGTEEALWLCISLVESTPLIQSFAPLKINGIIQKTLRLQKTGSQKNT